VSEWPWQNQVTDVLWARHELFRSLTASPFFIINSVLLFEKQGRAGEEFVQFAGF